MVRPSKKNKKKKKKKKKKKTNHNLVFIFLTLNKVYGQSIKHFPKFITSFSIKIFNFITWCNFILFFNNFETLATRLGTSIQNTCNANT